MVQVYQIGSRAHYATPLALYRIGVLKLLVTDFYLPRKSWQRQVLLRLSRLKMVRRALLNVADFPDALVHSTQTLGYLTRLLMPLTARFSRITLVTDKIFGWMASRIGIEDQCIVWGFTHGSLEIFSKAKKNGCVCVLEQYDPALTEIEIVNSAAEKWPGFRKSKPPALQAYRRLLCEWALSDYIIVNSEWSRDALISQGVDSGRIEVIPLAYDAKLNPVIKSRTKEQVLKVLWLGTCCIRKGIHILLEATKLFSASDVEFHIAGPIDVPSETLRKYDAAHVVWHGQVPKAETHKLFETCDVFVIPTLSDGFAITQLEAMSHAMPVIASLNCGRVVEDGVNGKLVNAGDVGSLVTAIQFYLDNPDFLERSSAAALSSMDRFSMDVYQERLKKFIARISD